MDQTVLVTGADEGLGFSLAAKFLEEGFRVFAGQYEEGRGDLAGLAGDAGDRLVVVPLDVADEGSVRRAAEMVAGQTEALDVLVNNAAIYPENVRAPLEELDLSAESVLFTIQVNSLGPLRVIKHFLSLVEEGARKMILNVSSEAGGIADCRRKQEYIYCMSKTALNMGCKILQNAVIERGIKVLAVHPGWMRTRMGGPDADLHPDESAAGIVALALGEWELDGPMYVNHDGTERRW